MIVALSLKGFEKNNYLEIDTLSDNNDNSLVNEKFYIDLQLLGVDFGINKKIHQNLSFYIGLGLGPVLHFNTEDHFFQIFRFKTGLDIKLSNKVHLSEGVMLSPGTVYSDATDGDSGPTIAIETGIFYKVGKVEFGYLPAVFFYEYGVSITSSLIVIRLPISKKNKNN